MGLRLSDKRIIIVSPQPVAAGHNRQVENYLHHEHLTAFALGSGLCLTLVWMVRKRVPSAHTYGVKLFGLA